MHLSLGSIPWPSGRCSGHIGYGREKKKTHTHTYIQMCIYIYFRAQPITCNADVDREPILNLRPFGRRSIQPFDDRSCVKHKLRHDVHVEPLRLSEEERREKTVSEHSSSSSNNKNKRPYLAVLIFPLQSTIEYRVVDARHALWMPGYTYSVEAVLLQETSLDHLEQDNRAER